MPKHDPQNEHDEVARERTECQTMLVTLKQTDQMTTGLEKALSQMLRKYDKLLAEKQKGTGCDTKDMDLHSEIHEAIKDKRLSLKDARGILSAFNVERTNDLSVEQVVEARKILEEICDF